MKSLLNRYVGRTVTAKSANDDIDINAICSACYEICSNASELSGINSDFYGNAVNLSAKALAVDNTTFESKIMECYEKMSTTQEYIYSIADQILEKSIDAYNNIQQKYNDVALEEDRRNLECTTQ